MRVKDTGIGIPPEALASLFEMSHQLRTPGGAQTGRRTYKVLIVDDNADLVEMLAILVAGLGHKVRKAGSGQEALDVARTYQPEVVLLDIDLPSMSGLDVARQLRRNPLTAHARLVALTGLGQPDDVQRSREAGFDSHLTKPTDAETVDRDSPSGCSRRSTEPIIHALQCDSPSLSFVDRARPPRPVQVVVSAAMRLLIVEDETKVATFVQKGFQEQHYAVDVACDGAAGWQLIRDHDYDLIILDLMLPKISGLDLLQRIRERKHSPPVLILTARGAVQDRVEGLNRGADDYLVKPFAFAELSARVQALLRRGAREAAKFSIADLTVDVAAQTVTRAGRRLELSNKEFSLLEYLIRNAGRPVTRTMIIEHVWDLHFDSITNVVEVYINYLRNKVDKQFSHPLIHTVRGVGYMLSDES